MRFQFTLSKLLIAFGLMTIGITALSHAYRLMERWGEEGVQMRSWVAAAIGAMLVGTSLSLPFAGPRRVAIVAVISPIIGLILINAVAYIFWYLAMRGRLGLP